MSVYKLSNVGGLKTKTAYTSFLAGNSQYVPPTYEAIATTTLASGASSITFSSIPADYTHLQIRGLGRASNSVTDENLILQLNSDTGTNYSLHNVYGTGAAVGSNAAVSYTASYFARVPGASSTANIYGVVVSDILDYKNTNKYKTIRSLTGHDQNGSGYVTLMSGNWRSLAAVTSLTIKNESGLNIAAGSSFTLYGIRSAL